MLNRLRRLVWKITGLGLERGQDIIMANTAIDVLIQQMKSYEAVRDFTGFDGYIIVHTPISEGVANVLADMGFRVQRNWYEGTTRIHYKHLAQRLAGPSERSTK
jgi:hypothetical protein